MQLPKHTRTFDLIELSSFYLSKPKSSVAFIFMEGQSRSCCVSLFIKCMGVSYLIALAGRFGCGIFTSLSLFTEHTDPGLRSDSLELLQPQITPSHITAPVYLRSVFCLGPCALLQISPAPHTNRFIFQLFDFSLSNSLWWPIKNNLLFK